MSAIRIFFMTCLFSSTAFGQIKLRPAEVDLWRKDIAYFANELPKRHKNLYHSMSKKDFDNEIAALQKKLPALSRSEVIVTLSRIITKVGDGHSTISNLLTSARVGFTYLPIGIYIFKDGTYIYAGSKEYENIVGGKIIKIGNTKIEDAIKLAGSVISHDNEMGIIDKATLYLTTPEVLHALKITTTTDEVLLTVEKDGKQITQKIKAVNQQRPTGDNWTLGWKFNNAADWVDARTEQTALWLKDPQQYYWYQYLPQQNLLYFAFNGNANKDDDPLYQFSKRVFRFIDSAKVEKFVLDLRWNFGGNNQLNRDLIVDMIKSQTDQQGKSFTLIGRHTFSAAQSLVNALEKFSNTIFVGEPTASNPNFYADPIRITLPNSGIVVGASSLWWQDMDPRDKRIWTAPHAATNYSWQDYLSNNDPSLQYVINYKPQKKLYDQVREKIQNNDLKGAIEAYKNFKNDPVNFYVNTENEMNNLGYYLLGQKKYAEAIEVFKLNAASYPLSANAFDSLAEAYMNAGNKELAIENYEQSLKLNPSNFNAVEMLKQLKRPNK